MLGRRLKGRNLRGGRARQLIGISCELRELANSENFQDQARCLAHFVMQIRLVLVLVESERRGTKALVLREKLFEFHRKYISKKQNGPPL